jgi:outer membrane protein
MKAVTALVLILATAATAGAQDLKLGFVDLQRALNESEAGKRAKEDFRGQLDKLQSDLKRKKDELDRMKEQIEKKSAVLKDEERRNLEKDFQKKVRDFERSYKDSQTEMQGKDGELTARILADLQEIIQEYGRDEGYTLILEASSNVLYGASSIDLTDKVIEAYNARGPRKGR